jgi:Fe-S-cluster containining protein
MESPGGEDFCFVMETPDGTVPQMQVNIPDKPVGLADLVPFMHSLADEIIGLAVKKAEAGGERVSCGPGCGVCCRQLIPLSAPEVYFMVRKLLEMPASERAPILRRFEAVEKRMEGSALKQRILAPAGTDADTDGLAREYFRLEESCPFLAAQSCSIHRWRPVVCREFNVLSDPALCKDPFVNKLLTIPLFRRPSSVLALLASQECGIDAGLVPMPLMFDWYESNKELGLRTWPAGILVRKLLDITVRPRTAGKPLSGRNTRV